MTRKGGFISPTLMRRAMQRQGLTAASLAALLDVSPGTVRNWLAGRNAPAVPKLALAATVLEVAVQDLTGVDPSRQTLTDIRVHAGMEQSDASKATGISQSVISELESGALTLSEHACTALAQAYGEQDSTVRAAWQRGRDTLTRRS